MRDLVTEAGSNSARQNAAAGMPDQDDRPWLRLQATDKVVFDSAAQPLGTARVHRQRRADGPKANARQPRAQGLEIPVVAEKSGENHHQAAVSTWNAEAIINRVRQQLRKLGERQRFGR